MPCHLRSTRDRDVFLTRLGRLWFPTPSAFADRSRRTVINLLDDVNPNGGEAMVHRDGDHRVATFKQSSADLFGQGKGRSMGLDMGGIEGRTAAG
jgi:hypothetical protein